MIKCVHKKLYYLYNVTNKICLHISSVPLKELMCLYPIPERLSPVKVITY